MALRNRVDPWGRIVAVPERGTVFGNRGRLHDDRRRLVRTSQVDRWICCRLRFRDRHREVMTPGRYTELFFTDEASAFAAGHRPCGECRHADLQRFRRCWRDAGLSPGLPAAGEVDTRLARDGRPARWRAPLGELPDGVFVERDGQPLLWWSGGLRPWSWSGYGPPEAAPARVEPTPRGGPETVTVLTPPATTRVLAAGYAVAVHPSAAG